MKLVIAEKPSVAMQIAKVIGASERKDGYVQGNGYIVSWCVGHLLGLAEPESYGEEYKNWQKLPIVPDKWKYAIKQSTKTQFEILKNLMNHATVDSIVCATDAGREGELIFRHVYSMSNCKKPFERLWISSLEDGAIKEGFENLKNGSDYDDLYKSALCRERADWLVGMNGTRLFSTLYNSDKPLSIGRVQTPTLAMIAERDLLIAGFVKEKYYSVVINCGSFSAECETTKDLERAKEIFEKCKLSRAVVKEIKEETKTVSPPKLYDLTALQRDANRLFAFTAQQTLEAAQRLYELKLITYPRTDSRFLTEDMEATAENIIHIVKNKFEFARLETGFASNIKPVMNNKKVSDHHAIIPTANVENADIDGLTDTDKKILWLLSQRLIAATGEKHLYRNTTATLDCNGILFFAKGKSIIQSGFKATEERFGAFIKQSDSGEQSKEKILPKLSEGQEFAATAKLAEHLSSPPKAYTEDTLLSAMERAGNEDYETEDAERKGLGTPATRAGIIETIIARGYVQRKGKNLISTERGRNLVKIVPEPLKSAKMTADWENRLTLISKGQAEDKAFMSDIISFVEDIISKTTVNEDMKETFSSREAIGRCPRCGSPVYEGKQNFYCSNKSCDFALWKDNKYFQAFKKTITKAVAKALLEKGRVHFKDLWSKNKNKAFEADIVMDANNGSKYPSFSLDFSNNPKIRR